MRECVLYVLGHISTDVPNRLLQLDTLITLCRACMNGNKLRNVLSTSIPSMCTVTCRWWLTGSEGRTRRLYLV